LGRKTGGPKERGRLDADGPAGKKEKGKGWAAGLERREKGKGGFGFFFFFPNPFETTFQNLLKIKPFTQFFANFHKPFSQLFLKTFKATRQQTHAFQHDAHTLGYFLN
jgi:hypothetical protein